jgi:hypothetical protein
MINYFGVLLRTVVFNREHLNVQEDLSPGRKERLWKTHQKPNQHNNIQAHQKYMKLLMENPNTGIIKRAPVGVSWATLFFPSLPALFRGDIKWFIIQLLLAWTLICPIIFAFIYNKQYINTLLERGFKVKDVEGGTLEDAKKTLSINLPQFETKI